MRSQTVRLFQTLPHACGYCAERTAQNLVIDPAAPDIAALYDNALARGYRRASIVNAPLTMLLKRILTSLRHVSAHDRAFLSVRRHLRCCVCGSRRCRNAARDGASGH